MAARRTRRDRIIDAAIELAGERRWDEVTLSEISGRAKLSLADLRREFSGRTAILSAFFDRIDADMLEVPEEAGGEEVLRDRIFDLIMRRFDVLGPHKPALRNIVAGLARDPVAVVAMLMRLMRTQRWVLDAAGATVRGLPGRVRIKGLTAVYARAFRTWLAEDDPGMPRTMATLDRSLRSGEHWLERAAGPIAFADALAGFAAALAAGSRRHAGAADRAGTD